MQLHALLNATMRSDAELFALRQCLKDLQVMTRTLGTGWQVQSFGSTVNLFGTRHGDLDVTCFRAGKEYDGQSAVEELRTRFVPLLQESAAFELVQAVWLARVPVLKLRYKNYLDVDLTCQNTEALLNTQLLKAYAKLHPVVREVVVIVKLWAKASGVCGAPEGHLSSYSITLMVIYFLQVHSELQMPCLPTTAFDFSGCTKEVE